MTAGLTPEDVFVACELLRSENVPLTKKTGHAVQARLGRGSKSTVQKCTVAWLAIQRGGQAASLPAAMATIQNLIETLVDQARRDERETSSHALDALREENRLLTLASARATADLEDSREKHADLERQFAAEQARRKEAEAQRDQLSGKLRRAQQELSDALQLRAQDRFVRDAAETLAARIA